MNCTTFIKTVISGLLLILAVTTLASAQNQTHKVKKGETLFSIARQYDIEVQQLKEWNNIDANDLRVGQTLIVRKTAAAQDSVIHTVETRETLFSIAKKYNVRIAEIKSWNNLTSNNLTVGQKLTIYPSQDMKQEKSIVVEQDTQQNTYYTVKSGDSLYRIAEAHNMTVEELKQLNDLSSSTIRVGQKLTVRSTGGEAPPSVDTSVTSSPQGKFVVYEISGQPETLNEILSRFHMSQKEFQALNRNVDRTTFQPGQKVTVLAPPSKRYKNPYIKNSGLKSLGTTAVSQYSESEKAKTTTNGELYNPEALTAAHSNISLGSVIFIENPENNKGIYVRINDRNSGRGLKLSSAAWQLLGFKSDSPSVTIYQN